MDCRTARERMREADPPELVAGGRSVLSRHIAGCADCHAAAVSILAQLRVLQNTFASPSAEAMALAVARALPARRRARRHWPLAIPLAAAAALASITIARFDGTRNGTATESDVPDPRSIPIFRRAFASPSVNAPRDRDVAVFRTADPNITIVWYFTEARLQ